MIRSSLAFTVVALSFAFGAACSSGGSDTQPKQETGGAGGGAASGSGAGGAMATGTGGAGGTAPTCDECGQASCGAAVSACKADSSCAAWLACTTACTSASCAKTCTDAHQDAAKLQAPVVSCLCQSCGTACAAFDVCNVCIDDAALPVMMAPPDTLSQTGLYTDIAAGTVAPNVQDFHPKYPLWSDGATKVRRVYLPKCGQIDTSDMDHWQMPVGTRLWKEFTIDGTRVETRLIHRFGPGSTDWFFAAYQWAADLSDATHVPDGVPNANGTTHDIPNATQCATCHTKLAERVLGFSAFQLSHSETGVTIASLSNAGKLTVPNATGYQVPGDAVAQAALGYLHANCGNCHNSTGVSYITMHLRLLVSNTTVQDTDAFKTAVGIPTDNFICPSTVMGTCYRIAPGDAVDSAVVIRMSSRGDMTQMPPLSVDATKVVDGTGVQAVSDWISTL